MTPNGAFFLALLCYNSAYPDFVNSSNLGRSNRGQDFCRLDNIVIGFPE